MPFAAALRESFARYPSPPPGILAVLHGEDDEALRDRVASELDPRG